MTVSKSPSPSSVGESSGNDTAVDDLEKCQSDSTQTMVPGTYCCCQWTAWRIGIVIAAILFTLGIISLILLWTVPPLMIERALNSDPTAPTQYYVSDIAEDSFKVRLVQNTSAATPIVLHVKPWIMTYGTLEDDFGTYPMPAFDLLPGNFTHIDSSQLFQILRPDIVKQIGRNVISSIITRQLTSYTIVTKGPVTFEALGFLSWTLHYYWEIHFDVGDPGPPPVEPNNATSPVHVIDYRYKFPLGADLLGSFDNQSPVSVDLGGAMQMDLLTSDKALLTATLPNTQLGMGQNNFTLDFQAANLGGALNYISKGFDLFTGYNKTEMIRLQNLRVRTHGARVSWLNGWFKGMYMDIPVTKKSLIGN